MKPAEVRRWRLAAQRVTVAGGTPADVVRQLGALQAQDYGQAVWAVGVRSGATLAEVEQALEDGEILRTWPMRGTIHLMAPEDARWWLALCAMRIATGGAERTRLKQLGLSEADIARAGEWLAAELGEHRLLTRAEAMAVLQRKGLSTEGQRGYHVLAGLAQRGVLCLGPMRGKEQTFALLDDRAPRQRDLGGDEALAELAGRYVTGHGPATDRDLAHWAGITLGAARTGLAAADLGSTVVDDETYWHGTDLDEPPRPPAGLLLPGFDEYLLGYRGRSAVIAQEHVMSVVPGGNGVFKPMVVLGGAICGIWARKVTKAGVALTATLFEDRPRERTLKALAAPARRYARFLGVPLAGLDLTR